MKCINCRCVIPETADYCIYCGHAVENGRTPTYPVRYPGAELTAIEQPVFHPYAACDDPNQFYGILEENDGSDAYDTYYEADYLGYQQTNYPATERHGGFSGLINNATPDVTKLLWCFAGLDCIIIILLLIILLLMLM